MKRNKHLLFLLIVIGMLSCNKKDVKFEVIPPPCEAVSVEPYLVGKWKMVRWGARHYNLHTCDTYGGNYYNCEDWGTNVVIEIEADGTIKTFKDDALMQESVCTRQVILNVNNYGMRYDVSCGQMYFVFINNNPSTDSLHTVSLGDTIKIWNPYVDINFSSGQNNRSIPMPSQLSYIKIE